MKTKKQYPKKEKNHWESGVTSFPIEFGNISQETLNEFLKENN